MKWRIFLGTFVKLLTTAFGFGQSGSTQTSTSDLSQLAGVWRADMDGMPAVVMVVTDESGGLTGAMMFYLHMRKTVNDLYTSTPGLPEPLFALRADGDTVHFDVSHRRAHPPRTLNDPPVHFHLRLTGPNQAELMNESEHGPTVTMVRSDY